MPLSYDSLQIVLVTCAGRAASAHRSGLAMQIHNIAVQSMGTASQGVICGYGRGGQKPFRLLETGGIALRPIPCGGCAFRAVATIR